MKIGYARVSTQDQLLDYQIDRLQEYGCDKIFLEKKAGISFRNREEFQKMKEYARKGDTIIVWSLDRLGRNTLAVLKELEEMHEKGVDFISLQQKINFNGSTGKFMLQLMLAIAELERTRIQERTLEGLRIAKLNGVHCGRRSTLDHLRDKVVSLFRKKKQLELTTRQIAEKFDVSISTVYRFATEAKEKELNNNA